MEIFKIEQKEKRKVYRLFGRTIFRSGEKRRGMYDMKRLVEDYIGYKTYLKKWEIQHGWAPDSSMIRAISDFSNFEYMLVWSKKLKEDWEKKSDIPCEVVTSPFVLYRRKNNIVQSKDAKGTIAYPAHSIIGAGQNYDIDEYCQKLRELPEEFQPVTIQLHHLDIDEYGMDKEYEKRGFKTVCASYGQGDKQFYEAFYDILKNFKYATSNDPGTYMCYAIEMGIPFFFCGEPSVLEDKKAPEYHSVIDYPNGKIAYEIFSKKPSTVITKEQKEFVEEQIGINDGADRETLRKFFGKIRRWI